MTPLLPLLGAGVGFWLLSKGSGTSSAAASAKQTPVTGSWTDTGKPVSERMALALATRDPAQILTLAGQLRSAGQTAQADALTREATALASPAGAQPSAPAVTPVAAQPTPAVVAAQQASTLNASNVPSGLPQLGPGEVLQYSANPGAADTRVAQWQKFLVTVGLLPAGGIDGIFGPQTQQATMQFQQMAGLTQDGIVGEKTLAAAASV